MPEETATRRNISPQLYLLLALLLITILYETRHVIFVMNYMSGHIGRVLAPGSMSGNAPVITDVEPEAAKAGVSKGDTLLEVNGKPFERVTQVIGSIEDAHAGDRLSLTVRHKNGGVQHVQIPLVARVHSGSDHWLFVLLLHVLLPVTCITLGFTVALLRPQERLAWIFLGLLIGFSQIFGLSYENLNGTVASDLAVLYKGFFAATWVLWLFLLGVYFPEQLPFERRHPWMKYLVVCPLLLMACLGMIESQAGLSGYAATARLNRILPPDTLKAISPLFGMIILTAILGFFVLIIAKYFVASTKDARRRLRLLYGGMLLSLGPSIALVIASGIQHKGLDQFPGWIELPCLTLTLLFPVTLAYIIVAYRAMDIRVVVRQGLRYTLAQRGIRLVQALLTAALALGMVKLADHPGMNAHRMMPVMGIGIPLIFLVGFGAKRLGHWVDRRFFRDSYNAEHLLMELSEQVRTIVEMHPLLETVTRKISESLHVEKIAVLTAATGSYEPAYAMGFDTTPVVGFAQDSATVHQLNEARQPQRVYLDDPNNWVNRPGLLDATERDALAQLCCELLIPLQAAGRLQGFLSLGQKRSEEPYSRTDLQLLASVATQTGLALENARLTSAFAEEAAQREAMKREVEIARQVQERLFPQILPEVNGLDYFGACRPARGVGGDYSAFLPLPGGRLGIAIGDVSGKGISAALMMASLQASLRGQTVTGPEDLASVVARVNQLVYEVSSPERYATFFFAEYDPKSRLLTYVNAGHNPPMLLTPAAEGWQLRRLEAGGTVVGMLPSFPYTQAQVQLAPGDILAAYTDGISEAMDASDEEWGEDKLLETLKNCHGQPSAEMVRRIIAAADAFTAEAPQFDDMTVVVARVTG